MKVFGMTKYLRLLSCIHPTYPLRRKATIYGLVFERETSEMQGMCEEGYEWMFEFSFPQSTGLAKMFNTFPERII